MRFASTQSLSPLNARSWTSVPRNRPTKRQSGWNPPSNLAGTLKEVWDHEVETYTDALGFKNYGWDQVIAGKGQLNVCVRWESSASITAEQQTKWVSRWDNFPYEDVKINVVGWAVKDKSLLQGSTDGLNIYTDTDAEGIPQCSEKCGRFFHQDGDYSQCPGGAERHYNNSLWLTDELLSSKNIHILQHEIGHTFGLDDFYDWTPTGQDKFIILAGSAAELSRERGWQSGAGTKAITAKPTTSATKPTASKATAAKPTTTVKKPAVQTTAAEANPKAESGVTAAAYAQCGGRASYTGPTKCASSFKCTKHNKWYSQCI
ncbi:hypothetical protein LB507_011375 [Fusarium sp. FIESC RH6]|nr:hypothetical protein LB507_011375 [Fusarium sp. FIESC RH6]